MGVLETPKPHNILSLNCRIRHELMHNSLKQKNEVNRNKTKGRSPKKIENIEYFLT